MSAGSLVLTAANPELSGSTFYLQSPFWGLYLGTQAPDLEKDQAFLQLLE